MLYDQIIYTLTERGNIIHRNTFAKRINMMRVCFIVLSLFLVSCSALQPAKPTPVPLNQLDLEPLLVQSGDLPAGLTGAQVKDIAPEMFATFPKPTKVIDQRFQRNNQTAGGVTVLLYETVPEREQAYGALMTGLGKDAKPLEGTGEQGSATTLDVTVATIHLQTVALGFRRCTALVYITLAGTATLSDGDAYAKRLDKRLTPLVCR